MENQNEKNELNFLTKKLMRRENDILNIRKRLDEVLDKLDQLQVQHDEMANYIVAKEGKLAYLERFCFLKCDKPIEN
jgi:septal ring factor EnvC (AmiA/AmiB activator)